MDKQIFFVIDGKELELDKVLVEFNEAPIFFVCKLEQTYYISSCIDMENERYIAAKIKLNSLAKMLRGTITMRDLILQAQAFWDITVGKDISEDIVIEKSAESILTDALPYEGEYLTLATKDLKEYAEKIDALLYDQGIWERAVFYIDYEYFDKRMEMAKERLLLYAKSIYEYENIIKSDGNICFEDDDSSI